VRVIYLACPYTGDTERNMEKFCRAVARMQKLGTFVISPLFMHFVLPYDPTLGKDWLSWQAYSRELLSRSDELHILCLDGWEKSEGIRGEIAMAEELGKSVEKIPASFAEPT